MIDLQYRLDTRPRSRSGLWSVSGEPDWRTTWVSGMSANVTILRQSHRLCNGRLRGPMPRHSWPHALPLLHFSTIAHDRVIGLGSNWCARAWSCSSRISHLSQWPLAGQYMTICPPLSDNLSQCGPQSRNSGFPGHQLNSCSTALVAHWSTIGVSVTLNGSLVREHRCVGGLGWVADAPEVPSSYRPLSLDALMSTRSSAELGGSRGVETVDRAERSERRTVSELAVTPRHR